MISVQFDVNDSKIRQDFFNQIFTNALDNLREDSQPLWGKMSAQNMIEHLVSTFELSNGKLDVRCVTPENLVERSKRFLYNNRPTPQLFKNPLMGEDAPPNRFTNLKEAIEILKTELSISRKYFLEKPDITHMHPLFGLLNAEEWERTQFKHCCHHLLQFGLIEVV